MKATANSRGIGRKLKIGAGFAVALSALIAIALILVPHEVQRINSKPMDGRLSDTIIAEDEQTGEQVVGIDWDYWQSVNPDIVGWITIPQTPIDYPLVQAHADSPTHYLNYDAYGNYNLYGCLYVDASCTIKSANVIIFGHNMGGINDSMFTTLTNYLDRDYLAVHERAIIQTPDGVLTLKVRAATSVSPYGYDKTSAFSGAEALQSYYLDLWAGAQSRTDNPDAGEIEQLFTLITCDKGGSARAVVYVG